MNLSGSGENSNILHRSREEQIDNPAEMEALEYEDEECADDPEIIEEMERRRDEIIETFIEQSQTYKLDEKERVVSEFMDKHPEMTQDEIEDNEEL